MEQKEDSCVTTVRIISELCTGCSYCADECALEVIQISSITGKAMVVNPGLCNDCAKCIMICAPQAIKFRL